MGAIISSIGSAINMVISAIAGLFVAVVRAVTMVLVTIWDVFMDILCCRCFSPMRRRAGRRWGRTSAVY